MTSRPLLTTNENTCQVPSDPHFPRISINPSHLHRFPSVSHSLPQFAILEIEMGETDSFPASPLFFENQFVDRARQQGLDFAGCWLLTPGY